MRILVLGGTYFLGKAFVEQMCAVHEITVLNRGTRQVTFSCPEHVRSITADRHSLAPGALAGSAQATGAADADAEGVGSYDVVVDFCAYEKGDIRQVVEALGQNMPRRYIFISTTDVYRRGTGEILYEDAPFEERDFGGQAGAYILGKAALERELSACARERGFYYTSIRPAFIYGPDNYAAREDLFFFWIEQAGQVIVPADETGSFQMVYVEDVARVIRRVCEESDLPDYDRAAPESRIPDGGINVVGAHRVTYRSFCDAVAFAVGREFERIPLPPDQIEERQIPLPFPLTAAESEEYKSRLEGILDIAYTPLDEGLRATYIRRGEALSADTESTQK